MRFSDAHSEELYRVGCCNAHFLAELLRKDKPSNHDGKGFIWGECGG
jgi:hypothetical protein